MVGEFLFLYFVKLSPIFKLRTNPTEGILDLLENTTLGTNGAKYKHLDTRDRIKEADNPLYLSIERDNRVLANVTFCKREKDWYIRYFAFAEKFQAGGKGKQRKSKKNLIKDELKDFFNQVFETSDIEDNPERMYAYIDPRNDRSLEMSHSFGFHHVATLRTQSFSCYRPTCSSRFATTNDWNQIKDKAEGIFGNHEYFNSVHCRKGPFSVLKSEEGGLLAFARFVTVNWEIVRLPGRYGSFLVKILPFIPVLRTYIRPEKQTFLVPEIVWAKGNDKELLQELFSSALAKEKLNVILWWVDEKETLYKSVYDKMSWGLFHKLVGTTPVNVMQRRKDGGSDQLEQPVFVIANDMV